MKRLVLSLALFALCLLPRFAAAQGFVVIVEPTDHRPPVILPAPPHPAPFALETASHRVGVKIDGQIATTTVEQEFYNPSARVMEGTYLFPIPRDAQIEKFQLAIDGKFIDAEMLDAAKARSIYEDIVRRAKDPALLEYAGQRLLKARIFPIEPRSSRKVRVTYREVLPLDFGGLSYRYPFAHDKVGSTTVRDAGIDVEVRSERAWSSVYSPSHAAKIVSEDSGRRVRITWEAKDTRPGADFELICTPPARTAGDVALTLLTYREPGAAADEEGFFALFAAPPPERSKSDAAAKDVIFVLDTSGSMSGAKIEQARKALRFCVGQLAKEDRFDVIRFSSDNEALFGRLEAADEGNRKRADEFITGLRAMGGTAIHDALKRAIEARPKEGTRPFVVIFLTDGIANIGPSSNDDILGMVRRTGGGAGARIFSFGIGNDVNTHLLDRIAGETRAVSTYVLPEEDIEIKLSNFFAKITEPVLTDLKLSVEGEGARLNALHPQALPDLFAGDQLVLVGRYRGKGDAQLKLAGKRAGREVVIAEKVSLDAPTARDSAREFIPRLWATRRVAYLLDEIRLQGENSEVRDEVTKLARKFGIVTPYTAYLIVEDEARRNVASDRRSMNELGKDQAATRVAEEAYTGFKRDQSGAGAVANARSQNAVLDAAQAPAALDYANKEAFRAAKAAPASPGQPKKAEAIGRLERFAAQGARFVNGRAFYQNGTQWVDSTLQGKAKTENPPKRVQVGSDEYFKLLNDHPDAAAWFALGRNVLIQLGGVDYEIHE